MTNRDNTSVIHAKPDHAAVQRQASQSLMLSTERLARTGPASPGRTASGPGSTSKRTARPRQSHPATTPLPHNIGRPNPLSP